MAHQDQGTARWNRATLSGALAAILVAGLLARASVLLWDRPWEPHHPDEHILPLEAIALWEGITPREVGWPATTTRLMLSATAGVEWLIARGADAWAERAHPDQVVTTLTQWIGEQYVDPTGMYKLGRWWSIVTGVLQLVALASVLRGWTGPLGVLLGTLAVALSPIVVLHSQYVLADITGLLFATLAVGRRARLQVWSTAGFAVCAALAAGSKLHFGLWLLAPLLSILVARDITPRRKLGWMFVAGAGFLWMFVTLFPWSWTNPALAAKEFLGVVAVKVGSASVSPLKILGNLRLLFSGDGMLVWGGALLGLWSLGRAEWRSFLPVLVPVVLGTIVLGQSKIVFDRYGLVLLPGLVILAAVGWERCLSAQRRPLRFITRGLLVLALVVTSIDLVRATRVAGEADVDVLARSWVLANVPRGTRIAMHDENNAFLPRSPAQLHECLATADTAVAYQRKWSTLGFDAPSDDVQPLRSMLLNDEMAFAYWCRRELQAQQDRGYFVVRYHNEPRSNAVLERDAIEELRTGATALTGGVDVLIANRPLPLGLDPLRVVDTRRGRRFIYGR